MNYLGRGFTSCLDGLRAYHRTLHRLRQATRAVHDAPRARGQLERLLFDLEVDVAARTGARATERMTRVEAAVFLPTLVQVQAALSTLPITDQPASWRRALTSALSTLRQAIRHLRIWRHVDGDRAAGAVSTTAGRSAVSARLHLASTKT